MPHDLTKRRMSVDEILELMRSGWELGLSNTHASHPRVWFQKGGLTRGGDTQSVHRASLNAALRTGRIRVAARRGGDSYWLTRYEETPV